MRITTFPDTKLVCSSCTGKIMQRGKTKTFVPMTPQSIRAPTATTRMFHLVSKLALFPVTINADKKNITFKYFSIKILGKKPFKRRKTLKDIKTVKYFYLNVFP